MFRSSNEVLKSILVVAGSTTATLIGMNAYMSFTTDTKQLHVDISATPSTDEAKLGRTLVGGNVSRSASIPPSMKYKGPVHEQEKCVHMALALFDAPRNISNLDVSNVLRLCVNHHVSDTETRLQTTYISNYVNWMKKNWAERRDIPPPVFEPGVGIPTEKPDAAAYTQRQWNINTDEIKINSGTLARILYSHSAGGMIVDLDNDEQIYKEAVDSYLQELDDLAGKLTSSFTGRLVLRDEKSTKKLKSLLAPLLIPARYWAPGNTEKGKRGLIIIGLHWEHYLRNKYPAIVKLVEEIGKTDPDITFPSFKDPLFREKYAVDTKSFLQFKNPSVLPGDSHMPLEHTYFLQNEREQQCHKNSDDPTCKHFKQSWWMCSS
jgi:hypothetical protein